MQGAAAWGFPSWLPHPLASLDKAPPVPQASPWRTLEVSNEWGDRIELKPPLLDVWRVQAA